MRNTPLRMRLRKERRKRVVGRSIQFGVRIVVLLLIILFGVRSILYINSDYEDKLDELEYTSMTIESLSTKINKMNDKYITLSDTLYISLDNYYEKSTDKVFRNVFTERFPEGGVFTSNREDGMIIIYALLESYPDIEEDKYVSTVLQQIEDNTKELHETVVEYNDMVSVYNKNVSDLNETIFCTIFKSQRVTTTYPQIILQ